VTHDDSYIFVVLISLKGIICKPTMEIYWSSDEMLAVSFSGKCMSHNRFSLRS
jgi:hypothetical protein